MRESKYNTTLILLLLVGILITGLGLAQLMVEISITSRGTIAPITEGKLSIGNEALGQNPCFFYDQNGYLVTLRMGHAWAEDWIWYSSSTLDPTLKWYQADIELMKNTSRNAMRIHMMPINFFDSAGNPKEGNWSLLLNALKEFKANGLYFILSWYEMATHHPSDYWLRKQWSDWSLFWNVTVQDNFIWMLNYTVNRLKEADVYSHLVYLTPQNEHFWTSYNTIEPFFREGISPYRHSPVSIGGTGEGKTTVAADSWHDWLRIKYNNNLDNLKGAWGTSGDEYFNYTGDENDFSSIRLSTVWDSGRQKDFQQWMDETAIAYTKNVVESLKSWHPDLYIGWDNSMFGRSSTTSDTLLGLSSYVTTVYGDVVDFHFYASSSPVYQEYVLGDAWQWGKWQTFAAFARALEKPVLVTETGVLGGGGAGVTDYSQVLASWESAISLAISNGFAGVCPWYIQSYQGRRSSWWDMTWEPAYQTVWKRIMDEYEFAQTWLDKVKYDKIAIVVPWFEADSAKFYAALLDPSGFNPQYLVLEISNNTLYPNIPQDAELIILSSSTDRSRIQSDNMITQINSFLNKGAKLILTGIRTSDFYGYSKSYENSFDVTDFPVNPMVYGTDYWSTNNSTDVYLDIYGTKVLVQRSASWCWYAGSYTEWKSISITGNRLINTTDGKPWVIANNQIAWISALYVQAQGWQGGATTPYNQFVPNTYLILKRILEYWSIYPIALVDGVPTNMEYTYAAVSPTSGVLYLNNVNATNTNSITMGINIESAGLDINHDYALLIRGNSSQIVVAGISLTSSKMTINVPAKWSETIVIKTITE